MTVSLEPFPLQTRNLYHWIQQRLRPEDMTRLLSSSPRSSSGPAQLLAFCTGMLGGAWERGYISLTRPPQQLHEQHAMLSLFSWAYSACVLFGMLFRQHGPGALSRSVLRFSAFRLLRCLRSPSRVTSRTRLYHIDDP